MLSSRILVEGKYKLEDTEKGELIPKLTLVVEFGQELAELLSVKEKASISK